jgi:hypothetical protein
MRLSPACILFFAACSAPPARSDFMQTRLLTENEFRATFASPMREVSSAGDRTVDVWPYVAAIPRRDLRGFDVVAGSIEHVYRAAGDTYDHVLVRSKTANVFLAIVVDLKHSKVLGHHLLDLNDKYGQPTPARANKI